MLIFLGLVLFVLLVVVHEFGHMIMAKKSGVEVEEFGIGFPPRAKLLTKKDGTEYTLNWLPLGGFVKLKGEHDSATGKGTFGAASFWNKTKIILAGVLMNWLAAIIIFTIIALIGMPQLIENQFQIKNDSRVSKQEVLAGFVEEGSPADSIGLTQGDRIVQINDHQILNSSDLRSTTKKFAGESVDVRFVQGGQEISKSVTLRN
ncbi:MAG: regulator of sigma protease, partial [Patescibacteria group bacterium]|nr:regulator of sigma protease [Patescibacteria group bacterium]